MRGTILLAAAVLLAGCVASDRVPAPPVEQAAPATPLAVGDVGSVSPTPALDATPTPAPSPAPSPTPSPTLPPTATATPTAPPTPTSTPTPTVQVEFVQVAGGRPGGQARVEVQTEPGAACSIEYVTPSGTRSRASGLADTEADADGRASWSWNIGGGTRPGVGQVTVTCNGASASSDIQIG